MYDELIKRLRELHPEEFGNEWDFAFACQQIMHEAADAIEELSKPKWVPVTEALPEQGKRYLVIRFDKVTKTPFVDILWYDAYGLWWNRLYKGNYNVTHWMLLPEQPKEGERE